MQGPKHWTSMEAALAHTAFRARPLKNSNNGVTLWIAPQMLDRHRDGSLLSLAVVHAPAAELGGRAELGSEALFRPAGLSAGRIIVATQRNIMGGFPAESSLCRASRGSPPRKITALASRRQDFGRRAASGAEARLGRKRARRTLSESHKCDMKLLGWSIIPASCSGVVDKDTQPPPATGEQNVECAGAMLRSMLWRSENICGRVASGVSVRRGQRARSFARVCKEHDGCGCIPGLFYFCHLQNPEPVQ